MQVSVLPPPPRGWEEIHKEKEERMRHYWRLREEFYVARGQVETPLIFTRPKLRKMPEEESFISVRIKLRKKPVEVPTLRPKVKKVPISVAVKRCLWMMKQREQVGWPILGPFEPLCYLSSS